MAAHHRLFWSAHGEPGGPAERRYLARPETSREAASTRLISAFGQSAGDVAHSLWIHGRGLFDQHPRLSSQQVHPRPKTARQRRSPRATWTTPADLTRANRRIPGLRSANLAAAQRSAVHAAPSTLTE
jgi:hypothetical protein